MKTMYCFRVIAENVDRESCTANFFPVGDVFEMTLEELQNDLDADNMDADGNWKPCTIWSYDTLWLARIMRHKCEMDNNFANA